MNIYHPTAYSLATIMPSAGCPCTSPIPQQANALHIQQNLVRPENWNITQTEFVKYTNAWTITQFSSCRAEVGDIVKSPTFTSEKNDKLKWLVQIYPKGKDKESEGFVSVYLKLHECKIRGRISADFKFSIINPKCEEVLMRPSVAAFDFLAGNDWGFKTFVGRDRLFDKNNGFLFDDSLTIYCEINAVTEIKEFPKPENYPPIRVPQCRLSEDLEALFESKKFSDLTLCAQNREFNVHKAVLAVRSPMFWGMFSHNMKEALSNRVEIAEINADVLEEMLRFIYTDKVVFEPKPQTVTTITNVQIENEQKQLNEDQDIISVTKIESIDDANNAIRQQQQQNNQQQKRDDELENEDEFKLQDPKQQFIADLLKAADKYHLDRLKLLCEEALCKTLSPDSAWDILELADRYNANQLKFQTLLYSTPHIPKIIQTDSFLRYGKLMQDFVSHIMNCDLSGKHLQIQSVGPTRKRYKQY